MDSGKTSDPYIRFEYRGIQYRTETAKKTVNPVWNQQFTFVYDKEFGPHTLTFEVWDANILLKDKKMGSVTVNLQTLEENKVEDKYYPLEDAALAKIGGALQIELRLLPPHSEAKPSSGGGPQKVVVLTAEQAKAAAQGRLLLTANHPPVGSVPVPPPPYSYPMNPPPPNAPYPQYPVQSSGPPPPYPPQPGPFPGCVTAPPPHGGAPSWLWQAPGQGPPPGPYTSVPQSPVTCVYPSPQVFMGTHPVADRPEGTHMGHSIEKSSDSNSSNGGSSSEDDAKKTEKRKKDRPETMTAESVLIMEIKDIVPSATYGEIAKALIAHNNNKDLALKELVANLNAK